MIIVSGLAISSFIDLSSLLDISSIPEEFLLFNLLIIDKVYSEVIKNMDLFFKYTGCAKKKKDILNIHVKSEGINIFSQKIG